MPLNQTYKQNNGKGKGSGGAVGLGENPVPLKRRMIANPELTEILESEEINNLSLDPSFQSYEEGHTSQETSHRLVNNTCKYDPNKTISDVFFNTAEDLVVLNTHHDRMDEQVLNARYRMKQLCIA